MTESFRDALGHRKRRRVAASSPRVSLQKKLVCYLVAMSFLIGLASVSTSATSDLKWLRIIILFLTMVFAARWFRLPRLGYISWWLVVFSFGFVGSSLWSEDPFWGLAFKGMFGVSVVLGLSLSRVIVSGAEIRFLIRSIMMVALLGMGILFITGVETSIKGQLVIGGLNPNTLASVIMIFFLFAMFSAITERKGFWKYASVFCVVASIVLTFLSGSRAGASVLIFTGGGLVVFLVRPSVWLMRLLLLCGIVAIVSTVFFLPENSGRSIESGYTLQTGDQIAFRLLEKEGLLQETRFEIWSIGWDLFVESPILGVGWFSVEQRWRTVMSGYLQILLETGILGFSLFAILLFRALTRGVRLVNRRVSRSYFESFTVMVVVLLAGLLLHCVFESSLIVGTTSHSVLFAFTIGHLDTFFSRVRAIKKRG